MVTIRNILPAISKWLVLFQLDKARDLYSHYDKKLLVGDFDTKISDNILRSFLYQHGLKNLFKDKTCFKNVNNPSSTIKDKTCFKNVNNPSSTIDLFWPILLAFQNTRATFTGLFDCAKLVLTVLKTTFSKSKPKELFCRDYKNIQFFGH